jgi:outer membrane receptor protein involved in Fe transport
MHHPKQVSLLCALIATTALAAPGFAQTAEPTSSTSEGKRTFQPEFFSAYGPTNALDMVQRIPGFSIEGSEGRRGFGENAGNVLIDGDRPSTKSDDIFAVLSRIPASQVERIELTEQAGADGEARGKGQVVNVIRKGGKAISGTYEAQTWIGKETGVIPFGSASASLKRGNTTYEVNASYFREKVHGVGPEDFRDGRRQLVERRLYDGTGGYREIDLGGAIKTRIGSTKINLNAKVGNDDGFDNRQGRLFAPNGVEVGQESLLTTEPDSDFNIEVGGDIEFPLARKLTTKLVGLYRKEWDDQSASIETVRPGRPTSRFTSQNSNRPSEAVFRIQNDWSGINNHAIQFGAEFAYNRLGARFRGVEVIGNGAPDVSTSNVLVQETRLEPFISDVWNVSPALKIESGVIFEFSKLELSGGSVAKRSFQFAKPRLAATWTANKTTTMEFRAEHQVAQLDFNEFATSVDLGVNQVDAGNKDLLPEKTTTFSALVRKKFFERGSIQLLGSYVLVRDTQDLIPVAAGGGVFFDGTGNIGNSRRWNAELEITLPFDWITKPLGVTGMELKYVGHYHGSRVTDPVTGEKRVRSFNPVWHQTFEFRHDIAKPGLAWGVEVNVSGPQKAYFVSQYRFQQNFENIAAFIEYKKFKLGTIRLKAFNITGSPFERDRFLYSGTRASGTVTQIIERRRKLDPVLLVSLIGKF